LRFQSERLRHLAEPTPDAELHLSDRRQRVLDDLGDGNGLDLAGREVAEAR
jgi:hypothetical protein